MPRVWGPFFSLGASGTYAGALVYRTSAHMTTVSQVAKRRAPPSAAQVAHRERVREAIESWRSQPAAVKEQWSEAAQGTPLNGYNLWLREWINQMISPPGVPTLPP